MKEKKEDVVIKKARQFGLTLIPGERNTKTGTHRYSFWVRDRLIATVWNRSQAFIWLEGYAAALEEGHRRLLGYPA